ncbi:MAG TPA: hypothetical protein PLL54_02585 [Dermatophilaceae bacterium]|nr:hypothetical protein [Dermatophilaceae bacterium]
MSDDPVSHLRLPPLDDPLVLELLRDRLDRLLDACELPDDDGPAVEAAIGGAIDEIVRVLGRSEDPADWGDEVGLAVGEALDDLVPEGEEWPPPEFFRLLEAARSLAERGPLPSLVWTFLEFVDFDTLTPEKAVAHFDRMLGIPGDVPEQVRASGLVLRGSAHEDAGDLGAARADWETAYSLAVEDDTKASAAWSLAAVYADDDAVAAADWAWEGAACRERAEVTIDVEMGQDAVWIQLNAIGKLVAEGDDAETALRLARRLLSRPDRFPEEVDRYVVQIFAADASVQLNDAAGAMEHLELARGDWALMDDQERAGWQLARAQVGLLMSDVVAIENAVRAASPYVMRSGTPEERLRLQGLATALSGTTGQYQPTTDTPFDRLHVVINRIPHGDVRLSDVAELHGLAEEFDPVTQPHLIVMALLLSANVAIALGDHEEGRRSLARARAAYDTSSWDVGGLPSMEPYFQHIEVVRMAAEQGEAAAAPVADQACRDALASGALAYVVVWGATAALLWNRVGNYARAWEGAVAAVTANQELRRGLGHVGDRQAYHQRAAKLVTIAVDAAEGLGDPRLMAELLEVLRAQAMPDVDVSAEVASAPIPALLSALMLAQPSVAPVTDSVVHLPPTPLIVMPWGGIALGPWLAYEPDPSRGQERIVLLPVEVAGT